MPYYNFEVDDTIEWMKFIRFSKSFLIKKNYLTYEIGNLRGKVLEISCLDSRDLGKSMDL